MREVAGNGGEASFPSRVWGLWVRDWPSELSLYIYMER